MTDSEDEPALLLWGDEADLLRLCTFLRELKIGSAPLRLNDLADCISSDTTTIAVSIQPRPTSLTQDAIAPNKFNWVIGVNDIADFADKLSVLARCDKGHQYLDSADGKITIVVSKNEYPADYLGAGNA